MGSIPGSRRSLGGGNGNALQYSCLEDPMDRRTKGSPWGCKESDMTERLILCFQKRTDVLTDTDLKT